MLSYLINSEFHYWKQIFHNSSTTGYERLNPLSVYNLLNDLDFVGLDWIFSNGAMTENIPWQLPSGGQFCCQKRWKVPEQMSEVTLMNICLSSSCIIELISKHNIDNDIEVNHDLKKKQNWRELRFTSLNLIY